MLVKPSLPPPEPLQPTSSIKLNAPDAPARPVLDSPSSPKTTINTTAKLSMNVPNIQLEMDQISSPMAARLASSLLGHVLFLKSQIPFPAVQLARMPTRKPDSKAEKKRVELVTAIDTLTSHFETTFVALSSALAQRDTLRPEGASANSTERAHLLFVVGPSAGSAKARVALVFDGLEVKPLAGSDEPVSTEIGHKPETVEKHSSFASESSQQEEEEEEEDSERSESDSSDEDESSGEDGSDDSDTASESGPPTSRSPSPSSPSPTQLTPPTLSSHTGERRHLSPLPTVTGTQKTRSMPPPSQSHAEEQNTLRAADRLLSRTLASACAEEDGGMSSELAPTQTHILLRAPRRFDHPAWIPRQNMTRSLETTLKTFIADATFDPSASSPSKSKKRSIVGVKTEGVWISCRAAPSVVEEIPDMCATREEDEMIWWQWNDKLVGFCDW
ncbi:hypothetical protein BC835DRAFT_290587 [Cytidiella melzeri]|nr:hypothetical protein BC835DRAFT_290587 [Cytidiella melzeri]